MSDEALVALAEIIRLGNPIPLSWAVAHGNNFKKLLMASNNPELVLTIAGRFVPSKDLVLLAAAMARTVLKYAKDEREPLRTIQWSEKWAEGEASIENLRYANDRLSDALVDLDKDDNTYPYDAATWTANTAILTELPTRMYSMYEYRSPVSESAGHVVGTVLRSRGVFSDIFSANDKTLSKIVHAHLRPLDITTEDLVRLGKNGWEPSS